MSTMQNVRDFVARASADELKLIGEMINIRFAQVSAAKALEFVPGMEVTWIKSKRSPQKYYGKVVGRDARWIYVLSDGAVATVTRPWNWRVAPTHPKRL